VEGYWWNKNWYRTSRQVVMEESGLVPLVFYELLPMQYALPAHRSVRLHSFPFSLSEGCRHPAITSFYLAITLLAPFWYSHIINRITLVSENDQLHLHFIICWKEKRLWLSKRRKELSTLFCDYCPQMFSHFALRKCSDKNISTNSTVCICSQSINSATSPREIAQGSIQRL